MDALYYPFHLCHEKTLHQLVENYSHVHFLDFMALQLTPFMGATGFPDRMGDYYPELLETGRIIQGHGVSGALSPTMVTAVNHDLADPLWRSIFHEALKDNRRFQRGLVAFSQDSQGRSSVPTDVALLAAFQQPEREFASYTVENLQVMSRRRLSEQEKLTFEYGFGLIKTSAALNYSIQLCRHLSLVAVTDSPGHHQLLGRTCRRANVKLRYGCVKREGY
ncbi:hypothetical protein [Candidatus Nitrospira allomarina]|jgi:hypothetical protein|uniref:Uncharacterized protein n=1 Tax=Candidatus Nitrospira allomarina TaxID=3020900 RepID=A0AA96GDQ6_9BACT|nr:hypothetical protein [Candidatus Nitrospira allomarina]WNM59227.1 hypothetical protein PP769_05530 [Candidatus Nitrospira allomarina]